MGAGLSRLQRQILALALTNHVREGRSPLTYEVHAYGPLSGAPPVELKGGAFLAALEEAIEAARAALRDRVRGVIDEPLVWLGRSSLTEGLDGKVVLIAGRIATPEAGTALIARLRGVDVEARLVNVYPEGADLYFHEVLGSCFGFSEFRKTGIGGHVTDLRASWGKFFDRRSIGPARYGAASASASKALARLEVRGLASRVYGGRSWMGVDLTPAGLAEARAITANTADNNTSVSRYPAEVG